MMAPKSNETWGEASPAPTNAHSSTFSLHSKDEKSQHDSLSKSGLFPKDNEQNTEPKKCLFISSAQPTSAANLFGQQTSTSNIFSIKRDSSTLPKKSSPLKTSCEVILPDSHEPKVDTSNNVETQKFNWPTSNIAAPSIFASVNKDLSASTKSNFIGSVGKVSNIQSGLSQSTALAQSQSIVQNDIFRVPRQNFTSSAVNLIATENKKSKETNEFGLGVGFPNSSLNEGGIQADVNETYSNSFIQSLTAKSVSKTEMKLNSNIFGQANLSVSSSYPSLNVLMERKFLWDQNPNETKSFSTKSSDEPFKHSSQTSILSQNPKDTTSSEVHCVSGNENTKISTTETESSKALTRISNTQEIRKRNKYAPNVLPRHPLFRELALTSQIKDDEIAALLPAGCSEVERQQFFALFRLRALNKAMGKMFSELPVTSDPQIVLDFYMEERRIIQDECSSFGRKTKRKFSPEECEYETTNKKRKQFEVNNSEHESKKAVVEVPNFPRKRKLDDEYQESQNSEKRNKTTQNETSQDLFNYNDGMLMTKKEDGSLFMPKINPSSPLNPPVCTNKSEALTPLELIPSPTIPSLNSKTNFENSADQKQQNYSLSKEKKSYFKPNDPSTSSNLKQSSTANKFRSILDGTSHYNVFTDPISSTSEKQDLESNSSKLLQLTANNSVPLNPLLSVPNSSKSINEDSSFGNTLSKVTTDINEEISQKGSENKHTEEITTRIVESQDYEESKPKFSITNEEQTPEKHPPKISQSFETTSREEGASSANPFSGIQPSIKETVNFNTDSTKSKPILSGSKNDTEKITMATSASTENSKKRKLTEQNFNSDIATVPDTDNESEIEESETDQKKDPSYNPNLEISSAVSTPVEKTGVGIVASKRIILSPTFNAGFKTPSVSSETRILPENESEVKYLEKESGNEKEKKESKTRRSLLDHVSFLPNKSDQSNSDEKNIKTPGKKDFSGFQFQSFQENKNSHSDQVWKPGAPIVFASSTTMQLSPSFSASNSNPIKTDSTVSENNDLKKESEIKSSQFSTNLFDKENSNQLLRTSMSLVNDSEMIATTEIGVKSKPIFSTFFGNSGASKPYSTSVESVLGQPNQTLSIFGQNSKTGTSSLFGNSTGSLSLFGKPSTTATSSFFPLATNSLETSRKLGSEIEKIESDGQEETDLEAEKDEQIDLTSIGPGEENEEVLHEVRVRALQFVQIKSKDSKEWEVKGVGSLKILKHKENDNCRLLLRSDPSGKIILNRAILGNVDYKSTGKTLRFLSASETGKGLETWVLQVKTEEYATKLASVLEEYKPVD
ncbi:hypothetical protein OnM2_101020 [Erysiphe neolycopersici]|uniref:RanBD1 domain-containing protein n=1 Tax=Erysiphe neolycopersici TaxID=212602 RepID=A0A420H8X3_9PEZI|nr:hypothetical protein OnM2_101020 [Erysiphe neolycopersici]